MMSSASTLTKSKGNLVRPDDPSYDDSIKQWATNAARKASIVAFVKDEKDVDLAIKYDGKGLDALSFEVLIMFAGIKKAAS